MPATFVLVALRTAATNPGWVSLTFGDGYTTAGALLSSAIDLDQ